VTERPPFIRHWRELEIADDSCYPGETELMSIGAPLAQGLGLTRIGIHHERLPPGRRTSYPHAESAEEEFVFVLAGSPDVWIDGTLHRLQEGDSVGFPAGTGICHSFLNNTDDEVRLLVVGERTKPETRIHYPMNMEFERSRPDAWTDVPPRVRPAMTARRASQGRETVAPREAFQSSSRSRRTSTSRLPTWLADETTPSFSICSINFAARL
jgi:uncharacterized cupin superfamily protein